LAVRRKVPIIQSASVVLKLEFEDARLYPSLPSGIGLHPASISAASS
jgi:hypothetical protein